MSLQKNIMLLLGVMVSCAVFGQSDTNRIDETKYRNFYKERLILNLAKNRKTDTCLWHNVKMKKTIVGTRYGKPRLPCSDDRFPNAKRKVCMGCMVPSWPMNRLVIIYHCKECDNMKRKIGKTETTHVNRIKE